MYRVIENRSQEKNDVLRERWSGTKVIVIEFCRIARYISFAATTRAAAFSAWKSSSMLLPRNSQAFFPEIPTLRSCRHGIAGKRTLLIVREL
jgi:hypothetical protein